MGIPFMGILSIINAQDVNPELLTEREPYQESIVTRRSSAKDKSS